MVSCTRIESTLQAYIDGELGDSDRAILEGHVAECGSCRESLRNQKRANAALFSAFSQDRLSHSLCSRVLAHLPEMESIPRDSDSVVDLINERAKNPRTIWGNIGRLLPAAAIAILIFITLVLRYSVSETKELVPATSIGMVTYASGNAVRAPGNGPIGEPAELQAYIMRSDRFETSGNSALILALTGPTFMKIAPASRVLVTDARNISLDYGRIWLDVGRDGKLFHVYTPRGDVTVFGTCFTVSYVDDKTTVTVERGAVQVEKDQELRRVEAGQQAEVLPNGKLSDATQVDSRAVAGWARLLNPDPVAEAVFSRRVQVKSPTGEIPSRQVYAVNTFGSTVSSVHLYWQPSPDAASPDYYSYDMYVAGADGEPLMHKKLEGSMFSEAGTSTLDIPLDTPITGMNSIEIRLVPDFKTGSSELRDIEVKVDVANKQGS